MFMCVSLCMLCVCVSHILCIIDVRYTYYYMSYISYIPVVHVRIFHIVCTFKRPGQIHTHTHTYPHTPAGAYGPCLKELESLKVDFFCNLFLFF